MSCPRMAPEVKPAPRSHAAGLALQSGAALPVVGAAPDLGPAVAPARAPAAAPARPQHPAARDGPAPAAAAAPAL